MPRGGKRVMLDGSGGLRNVRLAAREEAMLAGIEPKA